MMAPMSFYDHFIQCCASVCFSLYRLERYISKGSDTTVRPRPGTKIVFGTYKFKEEGGLSNGSTIVFGMRGRENGRSPVTLGERR